MPIRVLPQDTAAKIAAGEVIGRPADVVRELVDNAVDADATQVRVEIRAGGLELIRVADNGCGIPATELATAFERHATSKILEVDDLFRLRSLGFRGEALPSIAAVSDATLISKAIEEEVGAYIRLAAGTIVEQGPRACSQGTTISVRNLLQNVPARLKYLRAPAAESAQSAHVVNMSALAYPQIRFTLINDGRMAFHSDGTGKLHDAIVRVYGAEVAGAMVPVELDDAPRLKIYGYVSLPKLTRATRNFHSLFVNHRCVQSRMLSFAVDEAYHSLLPVGRHPITILNIEVPPEELDVNIHPTKAEVKFLRDRELYSRLQRTVREALAERLTIPAMVTRPVTPIAGMQQHLRIVGAAEAVDRAAPDEMIPADAALASAPVPVESPATAPVLRVLGQVGGTFIIAEGPNGMFLIDQHRAHERVLYERLKSEQAGTAVAQQLLLTPVPVDLNARQAALLAERLGDLRALGFEVEAFGERTFLVRALPAALPKDNLVETIGAIVDQAIDGQGGGDWRERLITVAACKGAIKSGHVLTMAEMRDLVTQLEATDVPPMCPHGGPVMVHLSQAQLERHFGRR